MTDSIKYEIQQLQNKIAELEQQSRQKEIEEENAKNPTFGYYFDKLFEFIKTKNDVVDTEIRKQNMFNDRNKHHPSPHVQESLKVRYNDIIKRNNAEYVPALEYIHRALYVINERLTRLENLGNL